MNSLLDIKQDLLVIHNGETIAQQSAISNQQSAISNQQSAISNQQSMVFLSFIFRTTIGRQALVMSLPIGVKVNWAVLMRKP